MQLNDASMQLILRFEVGGGEAYYQRFLQHPTWPKGLSGITIGVGYDLGYINPEIIRQEWGQLLPANQITRLECCSGKTGTTAQKTLNLVNDIIIPWSSAFTVFKQVSIPKFWQLSCSTFPGIEHLNPNCQGALVSLIFNRGTNLKGESRKEMFNIKNLIPQQDYQGIADNLRAMKRLWKGTEIETGMNNRRDAEADLVLSATTNTMVGYQNLK